MLLCAGFSLSVARGCLLFLAAPRASHCGGFSAVEQGALGGRASVVLRWALVVVAGFRSRGGLP